MPPPRGLEPQTVACRGKNRDANHLLLLPGRLVLLRPAVGQGADTPAQLPLQGGQGGVIAGRPAGPGAEPKPGKDLFVFRARQPARPAAALVLTRHVPQPSRPVQRARVEPALPEHPLGAHPAVVLLGVSQVDRPEHRGQGVGVRPRWVMLVTPQPAGEGGW